MLCSNQEMIRTVLAFLGDEPPVLCDWLPWNHTAGGNHNFGLVLYNGGTLLHRRGQADAGALRATLRNLREIPCTAHFTVPRFYEMLMPHLRSDAVLRETFFSDLKLSSTPRPAWASGSGTSCATWRSTPAAKSCSS